MTKPKIDVGDISHILKWNPDKDKEGKRTHTSSKDTKVLLDQFAKPTVKTGAQLKTSVEKKSPEKLSEALPVPPAEVQRIPQSRETQPVSMKVSASDKQSFAPEFFRSPGLESSLNSRGGTALGAYMLPNSSSTRAHDHYRSPKRRQLDLGVPLTKSQADLSSPSSVSSSSSPPVASMSSALSRDALESLTSRVIVRPARFCFLLSGAKIILNVLLSEYVGERFEVH